MFVLGILYNVIFHVCMMLMRLIVSFIIMNSTYSIFANVNNIPVLNGTNFKKWKEHVIIVLGCMDLDFALREDRPSDLTSASTAEQRSTMEKWERSNRMSLMIMKHLIPEAIRGVIPEETRARAFLD